MKCWECGKRYYRRGPPAGPFPTFNDDERIYRGCEPFCTMRCALNYARGAYDAMSIDYDDDGNWLGRKPVAVGNEP